MDEGGEIRGGSCIGPWRELEKTGRELDARKGKERGRKGEETENAKGGETPLEREDE